MRTPTFALLMVAAAGPAFAQSATPPAITLPTVIVTAQKEPADVKTLPVSVTAITKDTLTNDDVRVVSEAAIFAPNTYFSDFTARKLSNARFRGIGASPANPAITTYIDGVPQLNANSSSIELLDVDQIEFVRGPQSPLFGRNALGGVINIVSTKPALDAWHGSVVAPFGNFGSKEVRGSVSGPLSDAIGLSFAVGKQVREGYHDQRRHRKRRRLARWHVRQGPDALDARPELGGARHLHARTRSRRRLRPRRPHRDSAESVPRLEKLRGIHQSRRQRRHRSAPRRRRARGAQKQHRLSQVDNRRPDRPGLLGGCRSPRGRTWRRIFSSRRSSASPRR